MIEKLNRPEKGDKVTFEKVLLPVSNFANAENINFIISAEAVFKK